MHFHVQHLRAPCWCFKSEKCPERQTLWLAADKHDNCVYITEAACIIVCVDHAYGGHVEPVWLPWLSILEHISEWLVS